MYQTMGTVEYQTKRCIHCGKSSVVEIDAGDLARWRNGEHVQSVWPTWTPEQRELLITGTHGKCWDEMFAEEE